MINLSPFIIYVSADSIAENRCSDDINWHSLSVRARKSIFRVLGKDVIELDWDDMKRLSLVSHRRWKMVNGCGETTFKDLAVWLRDHDLDSSNLDKCYTVFD